MFLSPSRADGGDRSPWGDFWFSPVPSRNGMGMRITGDQALRLTAVYACVRNIAEDFASLPFRLYSENDDGTRGKLVTDHWLHRLFVKRPNRFQTPFDFRQMLQSYLDLRGNAFCEIVVNNGRGEIDELLPIHPDRMKIEILPNADYRFVVRQPNGGTITMTRGQVWHLKGLGADVYRGYNPIELQADMLGVGVTTQAYAGRFFLNDGRPSGGWVKHPGNFKDKQARETWRTSWQEQQTGENRGKVAVLEFGMDYKDPPPISNRDGQFIETTKQTVTQIGSMFRMPAHKIGNLDKATFSNIEQQSIEYGTDCISPRAERWESSIECDLLGEDSGFCVEFDLRQLMRGDSKTRAEYYTQGIQGGWLLRNEARAEEGLDPIDGLSEPLQPLNMVEPGAAPVAPATPVQTPADDEPDDESADARLAALLRGNVDRMARRLMGGGVAAATLAEALAVHESRAVEWLVMNPNYTSEADLKASLLDLATKGAS